MTEPLDSATLAERLHVASEATRYELLLQAASSPETIRQVREACALLTAVRPGHTRGGDGTPEGILGGIDDDQLALSIAAGRVPRAALEDPSVVDWLLACLFPGAEQASLDTSEAPTVTPATRRRLDAVTRPLGTTRRRRGLWLTSLGLAAAATIAGVMVLSPPADGWARSLDISRARAWRLTPELTAATERVVATGQLATALFALPRELPRRERAVDPSGIAAVPMHPRWEAVIDSRPEFRWAADGDATGFEILIVDADRNLVWSTETGRDGRWVYPADAPSLVPGRTYHWKVNSLGGRRLVASPYVGLRVLDEEAAGLLEADLRSAGGHPFLQGVAYDRHGLYTLGVEAFGRAIARQPDLAERAAVARAAIQAKQGLDP